MQKAILLLSPLEPALLDPHSGANAAIALKSMGASRADLATDPRFSYARALGHKGWPVPDFTQSARGLAANIFGPVLGRSDVCDLSYADNAAAKIIPTLPTLSAVGVAFANAADQTFSNGAPEGDGRDLGLIFYMALHGAAADRKPYSHMVFPRLSARANAAITGFCPRIIGGNLDGYGPVLDMGALRARMAQIQRAGNPAQRYN